MSVSNVGRQVRGKGIVGLVLVGSVCGGWAARAVAQVGSPTQTPMPTQTPQTNPASDTQTLPDATKLPGYNEGTPMKAARPETVAGSGTENLRAWRGLKVAAIEFEGVPESRLAPLPAELALKVGEPLDQDKVRQSLRRLYATGLYKTIDIEGVRSLDTVTLTFQGTPQMFIGRVSVQGLKDENLTSLLEGASKLSVGTPFTPDKLSRGQKLITETLQTNGYYQSKVLSATVADDANAQVNIDYDITLGKQARVGEVSVIGDSGLTPEKFRKKAKLKRKSKVTRETVNTALAKLRANYQKQEKLESAITLDSQKFNARVNQLDYTFKVNQGPKVIVDVDGVKVSKGSIRNLVPVYEEGAIDEDLLNEGDRRIHDLYQRKGYFNVQVAHDKAAITPGQSVVTYHVSLGKRHVVDSVAIAGNNYFETNLIAPRLNVHAASIFEPRGIYSQALVASDEDTIKAIYQGSGFSNVKVTPEVKDSDLDKHGKPSKVAHLSVTYQVTEGVQQRFGSYTLAGNTKVPLGTLTPLLNAQVGQPYNSNNLTGDRDAVLTYYLAHGFDQAQVNLRQAPDPKDANLIDVTMNITEGEQIKVSNVLVSGLHYTRPSTVADHIHVKAGDVLNQTSLIETQRQLYDLTLFNGVTTAVQNPEGEELQKNVLVQFQEAKRWDVNYGFGIQAQTGNPGSCNPYVRLQEGLPLTGLCSNGPNGGTGASELVTFDVSRINLRGSDNSLTLKTAYGSLEQIATLIFSDPHPFNFRALTFSVSGGYTNEQDVTTYAASRLEGTARVSQKVGRPNTFIYQFQYRRVSVDSNTVQVAAAEVPLLSQPVTVGGPGFTWIRDTRRPTPLDANGGSYNTVQEFFASSKFASHADFNRLDATNATYYPFGNIRRYVFARQTRIAYERSYGNGGQELIPLPERIYAGGAQSLRGFGINAAGPRDSETGFPIGGAAAFVNTFEMRFPPPVLPYVGNSVSFVLFHDMGNVFVKGSDIWPSFTRFHQPDKSGCRNLSETAQAAPSSESNSIGFNGLCSYNYFTHDVGLGARYHTPIGPIRVDASYNLNPPYYPAIQNYSLTKINGVVQPTPPYVGQAGHFNFFFSIGQTF